VPSTSLKQKKFMAAAAHNPGFAKKAGIPVSVAKEFNQADKGKKFKEGGNVAKSKLFKGKETYSEELKEGKAIKSGKITPEQYAKGEEGEKKMKKGGKCMAKGGSIKEDRMEPSRMESIPQGNKKFGQHAIQKSGLTKGKNLGDSGKTKDIQSGARNMKSGGSCYAKGGVTRADGVATKGHTKGKMV
jgi:hypothetical protein